MAEQVFEEQIQRLRELEAKATPAPWAWRDRYDFGLHREHQAQGLDADCENIRFGRILLKGGADVVLDVWGGDGDAGIVVSQEDARLIEAARNLLPSLLKEREIMLQKISAYEVGEPILQERIRELNRAQEVAASEREETQERISFLRVHLNAMTECYEKAALGLDAAQERIRQLEEALRQIREYTTDIQSWTQANIALGAPLEEGKQR